MFFIGATGFALFNALLCSALNATIVQAGIPMFIFSLNFLIYRLAVNQLQIIGYSITLIGAMIAASQGQLDQLIGLDINRGDLIMLVAALVYASYSVAICRKPELHWLSFLAALFLIAAMISIPLVVYEASTTDFIWPRSATGISVVLYTAIFLSIVGQA